jgi:hypothetical protein
LESEGKLKAEMILEKKTLLKAVANEKSEKLYQKYKFKSVRAVFSAWCKVIELQNVSVLKFQQKMDWIFINRSWSKYRNNFKKIQNRR